MSGLPALALAESSGGGEDGTIRAQVGVQALGASVSATGTARESESGDQQRQNTMQFRATTSNSVAGGEENDDGQVELEREGLPFKLESTTILAFSLDQLKRSIEIRKQELDDEEASSTSKDRDLLKNANPVRLAVHALLASKGLIGGIGPQVSEIAKAMNDSVATTTSAEAKIQSRGFLVRFLFGGDSAAAEAISQAVAKNQENIQRLTDLLNQASTTVAVKATLEVQIAALQDAQARLEALAEKEQGAWGLFSWRF